MTGNYRALSSRGAYWSVWAAFLLLLFHFESVFIGPIKVSHLWKGGLLVLLVFCVVKDWKIKTSFYRPFLLFCALNLVSLEIVNNTPNAIFAFSAVVVIPLIGVYAIQRGAVWSKRLLIFLSVFFIVVFLPYEIGLIDSIGESYELALSYGFAARGSIGPFQGVHAASSALAGALLVVMYLWLLGSASRVALGFLFVAGLYLLFNTYVRTGMAMFGVGSALMIGHLAVTNHRGFYRVWLVGIALALMSSAFVISNEALMARLLGERSFGSEFSSFEDLGSGRGRLALAALEIYYEASPIEKVVGMGVTEQKVRMQEKIGLPLVPHNGFLAILTHLGIVGLAAFLWVIFRFWISARGLGRPIDVIFLRALLVCYVVMTFFQQFDIAYMPVLMILAYSWKKCESLSRVLSH